MRRKATQLRIQLRSYVHNDPLFAPVWREHVQRTQEMRGRIYARGRVEARAELDRVTADNRKRGVHYCTHRDPIVRCTVIRWKGSLPTVPATEPADVGVTTGYAALLKSGELEAIKVEKPLRLESYYEAALPLVGSIIRTA